MVYFALSINNSTSESLKLPRNIVFNDFPNKTNKASTKLEVMRNDSLEVARYRIIG
jgi:hypothetical protein